MEVSGFVGAVEGGVHGIQVAGVVNAVGDELKGVQVAGLVNAAATSPSRHHVVRQSRATEQ